MQKIHGAIAAVFVVTLALFLLGGVLFVTGQAAALIARQGQWLEFFNDSIKDPMCIAASVCAVAGFLLSYKPLQKQEQTAPRASTTR
jgi:hypothetical protein